MHSIERFCFGCRVIARAQKLFDLVGQTLKNNPDFMPWCGGSAVSERDEHGNESVVDDFPWLGFAQPLTTHEYAYLPDA